MKKVKKIKKTLALLLTISMCLSLIPASTSADDFFDENQETVVAEKDLSVDEEPENVDSSELLEEPALSEVSEQIEDPESCEENEPSELSEESEMPVIQEEIGDSEDSDVSGSAMVKAEAPAEDYYVNEAGLEEISKIQRYLPALIRRAEDIDINLYTADSVSSLESALQEAKGLSLEPATEATVSEALQYRNVFDRLYSAYYTGLVPLDSFNVTLRYSDNQFARHEVFGNPSVDFHGSGIIESFSVEAGTTLQNLVDSQEIKDYYHMYHVIINGVYVHFEYYNNNANYNEDFTDFSKIVLHPNDEIVLFSAIPETTLGAALGGDLAMLMQYINSLRLQRFSEDSYTSEAAQAFTVAVEETNPALHKADGVYVPAEGLTIFVSEPQAEKGGLVSTNPLIVDGENVVTDENGEAELNFYTEGWVLVQAINLKEDDKGNYTYYEENAPVIAGTYYSMESGAGVWVHVTESTHPETIKETLLSYLRSVYESYDQTVFPVNRLAAFQRAYDNAAAAIQEAADTGTAYEAQQTGIAGMLTAYNGALSDNTNRINAFRNALSKLPDDVSLITQGEQTKVNNLRTAYTSMTDYQKSQLLQGELQKYEAIMALTDLGPAKGYNVTVQIAADTDEAAQVISDMVAWLNSDEGRYYAGSNSGTPGEGIKIRPLYTPNKGSAFGTDTAITGEVTPGQDVYLVTNFNHSAWLPVLYDDLGKTYVGDKGDEYTKVSGDGWTILDTQEGGVAIVNDHVIGNLTVLINGVPYEQKGITWGGVDGEVIYQPQVSYIENSTYKGKMGFNIYFNDPWAKFTMPYNDVTITVTWGPVDSSTETSAAIDALTAAYNSYVPGNYNDAQWASLTSIYQAGVAAIKTAPDPDAVKEEYIAQMAAVPAANPGTIFGSVTVTVSNNTCADGPWYDETEPFVSETIDLYDTDTMMTVVLRALAMNEFTWQGTGGGDYGITYLSSISLGVDELAEFTGGSGSGWMGMLNNWFVHNSFQEFSVANGTLKNGDHIEVLYTCSLGVDLRSGVEGISDTIMYDISMTNGTLSPAFNGGTKDYIFTLDDGEDTTVLTFEPMWRCFQSRAYKGSYQPTASSYYSSGDTVYLEDGDVLYVASGDPAWPSMSGNSGVNLKASVYTITVVGSGNAEKVQSLIDALPNVKYNNYQSCMASVEAVRTAYDALADTSSVNAAKLETAEQLIAQFTALDEFKTVLASVNAVSADESTAQSIVTAYDAMTDNQKNNLTGAETAKIETLRAMLVPEPEIQYGDLDGDGQILTSDAARLYAFIRGTYELSEEQIACADVNSDGEINTTDAAMIFALLRGQISSFPAQGN